MGLETELGRSEVIYKSKIRRTLNSYLAMVLAGAGIFAGSTLAGRTAHSAPRVKIVEPLSAQQTSATVQSTARLESILDDARFDVYVIPQFVVWPSCKSPKQ